MPTNSCPCPNPPGGKVICEPHQLAICKIVDGELIQRCLDPISTRSSKNLIDWTINKITDKPTQGRHISNQDLLMLLKGEYTDDKLTVKFNLPESISKSVLESLNNKGLDNNDKNLLL